MTAAEQPGPATASPAVTARATAPGEILELLRTLLAREFEIPPDRVVATADLVDDLDLDSIDAVTLELRIEEALDVELPEEALRELRTVQDLVDALAALRGARPPA